MTTFRTLVLATTISLLSASIALAQPPAAPAGPPPGQDLRPVIEKMPAKAKLAVTTPAFKDGGDIPFENTQYRGNIFPGLAWTKGPMATKSYALIMQDTDAPTRAMPILHWTVINIPASVTKLDAGFKDLPAGAAYGPNIRAAAQPYMGPRTPPGPKHHYHLQIFALDTTVADPGADFKALTTSLEGHILASGEVGGLGQADPTAPPPPPRPATPSVPATPPAPK